MSVSEADRYTGHSQNCVKSKRVCEYPPAKIPLRERRALGRAGAAQPWEHTPWEVSEDPRRPELPNAEALARRLILSGPAKTFSCVAIDMPLSRKNSFITSTKRAVSLASLQKNIPKTVWPISYQIPKHFPASLRTHLSLSQNRDDAHGERMDFWRRSQTGDSHYQIGRNTSLYRDLRGDLLLAETHLNVIYAISNQAKDKETSKRRTLDQELSDRYFLLTSIFIHGLKTILTGILRSEGLNEDMIGLSSSDFLRIIHTWHTTKGRYSQHLKLKALRMFPAFFNPPHSEAQLVDVGIVPIVQCFRELTEGYYGDPTEPSAKRQYVLQGEFWKQGPASEFYETIIMVHLNSISYGNDNEAESSPGQKPKLKASWYGSVITAQLYMEQVVRLWRPFKKEIYLYTMRVFQGDLSFALQKPEAPQIAGLLFRLSLSFSGVTTSAVTFIGTVTCSLKTSFPEDS
ncbi:uncharacterized protein FRV6_13085 [Fusarium oxysporum]|uniref:Uncharacterized protein n=1 Tax=Fusarium oxysporum TaxID=5507 RepID=A0A2H3TK62_FUSOX|nr:uncharacterized protein FRV6_13085 [Fusarium oxysporum]